MNGRRIQLEWVLLNSCFVGFGARLAAIRWRAATRAPDSVRSSAHP